MSGFNLLANPALHHTDMLNKPRILCVDDESNVLDSFRRILRRDFDLNTATSGADGLRLMEQNGPFAVIVSDYKMPGMDGVEFLSRAKDIAPDTVRIMLTGQADEMTAAKAINDGRIFRFLHKPIASSDFLRCLQDGIRQYQLVSAEKDVLERTLKGSIEVMTEILSLTNPLAFSRATRVQKQCRQLGENFGFQNLWQLEVAAMLSHLGYIAIPTAVLERRSSGHQLTPEEFQMFEDIPSITQNLIGHIPRLEPILKIVKSAFGGGMFATVGMNDEIAIASAILRAVVHLDEMIEKGYGRNEALSKLRSNSDFYNVNVLDQLKLLRNEQSGTRTRRLNIDQLRVGMVLNEAVRTDEGLTVAPAGFRVNDLIRQLLKNLKLQNTIPEFVVVIIEDDEE